MHVIVNRKYKSKQKTYNLRKDWLQVPFGDNRVLGFRLHQFLMKTMVYNLRFRRFWRMILFMPKAQNTQLLQSKTPNQKRLTQSLQHNYIYIQPKNTILPHHFHSFTHNHTTKTSYTNLRFRGSFGIKIRTFSNPFLYTHKFYQNIKIQKQPITENK